ncbi:hypothetical protein [Streptomyces violaceus]|uniref:Uncharacterized protein n=1 Tax=Streptomyces violaceus TaxID=1936 RepID=A0ABY9UML6_STRVL|nr:hypothetical protein [Streptomyces janthinus]WND24144.1 hypothetical protein RI060_43265 [Streptomyces janthinus]GGS96885.1 hypothetical protein GCM10010270_81100 [Streptomyces janthinus]
MAAAEREHGYARYRLDGCRCYVCGFARAQYDDNRNRAIAYGTWQPWVDADPVRVHTRHLQSCGMGLRAIAAAAGVDRKRLQSIVSGRPERGTGPQEKVRPALAAAVLSVEPTLENLAPSTLIGPLGTRRRLHALVAVGWPQQYLAAALGVTPNNFGVMLQREHVLVRRALAVRDLYDRVWRADPAEHGATTAGISRARRYAAERRWAPVGAWDDDTIDDPAAFPDWTGQCGTLEGYRAHRTLGISSCQPCRDAKAAYVRERREALRAAGDGGRAAA